MRGRKIWKTKDWNEILVQEMTTAHIKAVVRKLPEIFTYYHYENEQWNRELYCDWPNWNEVRYWKKIFMVELIRRQEFDFIIDELL